ncbi:MAG: class I SAM-dependent methyltransferase [Acidiferrobacterales bacterium]
MEREILEKNVTGGTSPITGNSDVTLLETFDTKKLADAWQNQFGISISDEFNGCKELRLYRCNQTGLKFFEPKDTVGSDKLYEQLQHFDWYYLPKKWEHRLAIRHLRAGMRILEIGSGTGYFLEQARQAGLRATGIELNQHAAMTARERGLDVVCNSLSQEASRKQGTYDAVCSFQVLEHVLSPGEFIENSVNLLKPGGILIYGVPNDESFLKYQFNILNMPPHHMTLWSASTFRRLEQYFPISLERVINEPLAEYHIEGYVASLKSRIPARETVRNFVLNKITQMLLRGFLRAGLRQFVSGQSLYVLYRKRDE